MEIITSAVLSPVPNQPPLQVFVTINGNAQEFEQLLMLIQKALTSGPQVFETRTSNGVPVRMLIDRIGPAQPAGG